MITNYTQHTGPHCTTHIQLHMFFQSNNLHILLLNHNRFNTSIQTILFNICIDYDLVIKAVSQLNWKGNWCIVLHNIILDLSKNLTLPVGLSGGSHEGLPTNPFTKPFSVAIVVICPKGPSPKNVTCHMHVKSWSSIQRCKQGQIALFFKKIPGLALLIWNTPMNQES